jgi:D-aspartate ligase
VYLAAQEGTTSPVFHSRYWGDKIGWDFFGGPEQESVRFLSEIGAELAQKHGSRPILLTPSDWFAIFIERHSEVLAERFRFPRADSPIVERLLDKWDMHALAVAQDIPTPLTARPSSREEIDEFAAKAGFPLVVKPADPYLRNGVSKAIARSRAELEDAVQKAISNESWNFVLQEFIPGGVESVWMCNGYFGRRANHGVVFTGRKRLRVERHGCESDLPLHDRGGVPRLRRDRMALRPP